MDCGNSVECKLCSCQLKMWSFFVANTFFWGGTYPDGANFVFGRWWQPHSNSVNSLITCLVIFSKQPQQIKIRSLQMVPFGYQTAAIKIIPKIPNFEAHFKHIKLPKTPCSPRFSKQLAGAYQKSSFDSFWKHVKRIKILLFSYLPIAFWKSSILHILTTHQSSRGEDRRGGVPALSSKDNRNW